ncbi:hypothetical protein [Nostoc sp.]
MKNSTHSWDGVFGHGEWGMGHGAWRRSCFLPNTSLREAAPTTTLSTSAQCLKGWGEQPRPPTLGMEFPADFNKPLWKRYPTLG